MIITFQKTTSELPKDMAITCIKQGLSYSEYQIYSAEYVSRLLSDYTSKVTLLLVPEDTYYELAIDLFTDIQSCVEEDSYIKQLDYTYMDNLQIIHYVFKYHSVI